MSCIHFKFKSSLDYEKLTFEGLQISLSEFKEAIMKQKKIGLANQYTLKVVDAQSKKVYSKDDEMLQRNTSVIICRIPLVNAPKIPKTQLKDPSLGQPASLYTRIPGLPSTSLPPLTSLSPLTSKLTAEELVKTADLLGADATEEDKIKAMIIQSTDGYDPSQYVKYPGRRGGMIGGGMPKVKPPATYTCFRCGQTGHYINHCPTNGDPNFDNFRYKRVTGTPSNQVIPVSMNVPGAMVDRHGNLVVKKTDLQAYIDSKTKGKVGTMSVPAEALEEATVPPELICNLCEELVKYAVIIPCCGESFCYECIQVHLCENEFVCPMCKATNMSPERLGPNKALRASAKNFKMKVAEKKSEAAARGFTKQTLPPPVLLNSTKELSPSPVTLTQPISSSSASHTPPASNATPATTAPTVSLVSSTMSVPTSTISMATPTISMATPTISMATPTISMATPTISMATHTVSMAKSTTSMATTTAAITTSSQSLSQESSSSVSSVQPLSRLPSRLQASGVKMNGRSVNSAPRSSMTVSPRVLPPIGHALPPALGIMMGGHGPPIGRAPLLLNGVTAVKSIGSVPVVKTNLKHPIPHFMGCGVMPGPDINVAASFMNPMVSMTTANSTQNLSKNMSNHSKFEKMADLLFSSAIPKKSPSPPPLSLDEFYRQQKLLKLLTKKTTSQSRSKSPGSYLHSSRSGSSSSRSDFRSRSRSRSWSYDSRSRSQSPYHTSMKKHSSHTSSARKHKKRHRYSEKDVEKSRNKDRERHRGTRSHHDARGRKEEVAKRSMKRHRSQTKSPDRKRVRESLSPMATTVISHTTTLSETEFEGSGKATHKHKHKKRSKRKHKHRDKQQESVSRDQNLIELIPKIGDCEEDGNADDPMTCENELNNAKSSTLSSSPDAPQETCSEIKTSSAPLIEDGSVNNLEPESEPIMTVEGQESGSTYSKEGIEDDSETHKQCSSNQGSTRNSSTSEVGQTGDLSHGSDSNTEFPEQSPPLPPEDSEMDEPLLLDVHVDESIDELEEELMGISSRKKELQVKDNDKEDSEETAKEEGEISDSADDQHSDLPTIQSTTSPLKQTTRLVIDYPHPPEQEDLREEIERSRQKKLIAKQNTSMFSAPMVSPVLPAVTPPLISAIIDPVIPLAISKRKKSSKKRKHSQVVVTSEVDSEGDLTSVTPEPLEEFKVVKKKKYIISRDHAEHSKHRHTHEVDRSWTREGERKIGIVDSKRDDRVKEKRGDRVREKKRNKEESREKTKSKKNSRDKKESKRPKDKSREKERKFKKKKAKKCI